MISVYPLRRRQGRAKSSAISLAPKRNGISRQSNRASSCVARQFGGKDRSERLRRERYFDDRDIKGATNMDLDITNKSARLDVTRITSQHDAPSGEIAFATGTSILGTVLVARSARGVCAVLIGSEAGELTADLAARFPQNRLAKDDRKLARDLEKVLRFIETPARGLDLELDVHGTPFQRRVGRSLRDSGPPHRDLCGARAPHRRARVGARRRKCLRGQRDCACDPVSPCDPERRHTLRLPLGCRTQACATRT